MVRDGADAADVQADQRAHHTGREGSVAATTPSIISGILTVMRGKVTPFP